MISITKMGKTIDEAKREALKELGLRESDVEIEILEEPKTGLFGFLGAKDAVIRVTARDGAKKIAVETPVIEETPKTPAAPQAETPAKVPSAIVREETEKETATVETVGEFVEGDYLDKAAEFLHEVIQSMGIPAKIDVEEDEESLRMNIVEVDERDAGVLIGKRGETLDALQYLTSIVANSHADHYVRVFLNTQGYREKREIALKNLARKMSNKALRYGRNMKLEPMNPYERRIIHSEVQKIHGVTSFSEGSEPYRRLVIQPERTRD